MSRIVRHYGSNRVQGKPLSKGVVQYRFNYSTRTIVGVGYEGLGRALRLLLALPGLGQLDGRDPLLLLTLQLLVQSLFAHALHVPSLPALLFLFRFRVTLRKDLVVQILSFTKRTIYFTELMKSYFIKRTCSLSCAFRSYLHQVKAKKFKERTSEKDQRKFSLSLSLNTALAMKLNNGASLSNKF